VILMARSYGSVRNFAQSEKRTKRGRKGKNGTEFGAKCAEGPKLRRGTAWPRNKCGLHDEEPRRACEQNGVGEKRRVSWRKGPLIAEILEANWNEDRG